jgi:predicted O-methyltransferase YrrM
MIRPERILEIGTFVGYSALCLAKGLRPEGVLHTIELREPDAQTARAYFDRSPYKEKICLHMGDALSVMEALKENWDLVFIDADKINYTRYYEAVFPFVKKGGWIIADNVLFHGEVLETPVKGKNAKAIDQFNRHILADNRIEHVMLTVRDGLMIIRKK